MCVLLKSLISTWLRCFNLVKTLQKPTRSSQLLQGYQIIIKWSKIFQKPTTSMPKQMLAIGWFQIFVLGH